MSAALSVALYLTIVSWGEYQAASMGQPAGFLRVVLLVAMGLKVAGVGVVYTSLYQAPRALKLGVLAVLAAVLWAGVELVVPLHTARAVAVPQDAGPLQPGRPAEGRALTVRFGCVRCHTVPGVSRLPDGLCPDLTGLADRAGQREPGRTADAYIRESIEDPGAYVVRGYLPWMPALRGQMTRQQFEDLVSFLETLHKR